MLHEKHYIFFTKKYLLSKRVCLWRIFNQYFLLLTVAMHLRALVLSVLRATLSFLRLLYYMKIYLLYTVTFGEKGLTLAKSCGSYVRGYGINLNIAKGEYSIRGEVWTLL